MSTDVNSPTGVPKQNFVNIMNLQQPKDDPSQKTEEEQSLKQLKMPLVLASNLKCLHHPFDEMLAQATGDVTVVMKIGTNQLLASKILMMMKGLASHIKLSIDQI